MSKITTFLFILLASPSLLRAQWVPVASMSDIRAGHASALLNDGRLLVAGGWNYTSNLLSAEIYDPENNSWTDAGTMSSEHYTAQAVTLQDGRVLVISGFTGAFNTETCDLYDPASGQWSSGGFLTYGRSSFTATLLNDGRVIAVGGFNGTENLKYCEIYDPQSNSWSLTDSLETGRSYHTASLLPDGRLLVAGGFNPDAGFQLSSVEIFDPVSNSWAEGPDLSIARDYHAASVLANGKIMVSGGRYFNGSLNFGYNGLTETEVYDPASNSWVFDEFLPTGISYHKQITLGNGNVLVIAGVDSSNFSQQSGFTTTAAVTYLYDAIAGEWNEAPMNSDARYEMTADVLVSGEALVTGGVDASAELFDLPLSVSQMQHSGDEIQLYPNPFNQFFTVKINSGSAIKSMKLFDATGREIEFSVGKNSLENYTITPNKRTSGLLLFQAVSEQGKTFSSRMMFLP